MAMRRLTPSSAGVSRPSGRTPSGSANGNPNRILAALPTDDYQRVRPHLQNVPFRLRQMLHKHGEPTEFVYFPNTGMISLTTAMGDGSMIEAATVGREGIVGLGPLLGGSLSAGNAMVQVAGEGQRLSVEIFNREVARRAGLSDLAAKYCQALIALILQSTGCNRLHPVEERLPRWLLITRDRVGSDQFRLTQEFLAMMLGVSRPTVTIVAGMLQKAGLIEYRHGHITILDGKRLEEASCECYRMARDHSERLLPGFAA